jgi:hypothetical protein
MEVQAAINAMYGSKITASWKFWTGSATIFYDLGIFFMGWDFLFIGWDYLFISWDYLFISWDCLFIYLPGWAGTILFYGLGLFTGLTYAGFISVCTIKFIEMYTLHKPFHTYNVFKSVSFKTQK